MDEKHKDGSGLEQMTHEEEWKGAVWDRSQLEGYVQSGQGGCTILLDGYVLQVAEYMKEHVGLPIVDLYPRFETHGLSLYSPVARRCFGDTRCQSPAGRPQTGLSTAG